LDWGILRIMSNIIADIDSFIVDRLKLITIDEVSLPVLPYEPSRERGHTEYPCASVSRVGFEEDKARRRFGIEIMTPNTTKKVINLSNGNVRIVPDGYTVMPYPGVYSIRYIIDTEAVKKEDADTLMIMMDQAFPFGFEPCISDQYVLFDFTKPIVKDELYKPVFKVSYLFDVHGVHISKLENYNISTMSEILFDKVVDESPTIDGIWEH
jgi:hypothetical protein